MQSRSAKQLVLSPDHVKKIKRDVSRHQFDGFLGQPGMNDEKPGPGSYDTQEDEKLRKKYMSKHQKLLAGQTTQTRVRKVGTNLVKANSFIPEFEETQKKLRDLHKYQNSGSKAAGTGPGPGQYNGIRDWKKEQSRKSYNLRMISD